MAAISEGKYKFSKKDWKGVSELAKDFTRNLLEVDPSKRLDAPGALQHPWLCKRSSKSSSLEPLDPCIVQGLRRFGSVAKFRRTCMHMMAWSLSSEESEIFRKNFLRIDTTHDGRITFPELLEALKDHSARSGAVGDSVDETRSKVADFGEMLRIFAAMDENGDWRVQYTDFLAAMLSAQLDTPAKSSGSLDRLLHKAFDRFDFDRSGDISAEDLQQVLNLDAREAQDFISEADANRSGSLSYSTFVRHVIGHGQALRSAL
jgi:Ca2+-binding EF-hand superfamily protein